MIKITDNISINLNKDTAELVIINQEGDELRADLPAKDALLLSDLLHVTYNRYTEDTL